MIGKAFQLWPAIDLIDGEPVRLRQGDYGQKTRYDRDLSALAEEFSAFASGIHVVDLQSARGDAGDNTLCNRQALRDILSAARTPVQLGGGMRSLAAVETVFALGVTRAIFGSAAVDDPDMVIAALQRYGAERIVIGIDARDGLVATHGWRRDAGISVESLIERYLPHGLRHVIFTDIATDGMLSGPNIAAVKALRARFPTLAILASGGVSSPEDLRSLRQTGVQGAVFGKAYYEGLLPQAALTEMRDAG